MPSKTISLKEETYNRLARAKGPEESFSDVIDRLVDDDDHPLYELVGVLDESELERLQDQSRAFREDVESSLDPETDA